MPAKNLLICMVVALAVLHTLLAQTAKAAAFRIAQDNEAPGVPIAYMQGNITPGDREALERLLRSNPKVTERISNIWLNSLGGDVVEAMKIGQLIEDLGYTAVVPEGATCASACFFVWVSASAHLAPGALVIHRPYFPMAKSSAGPRQLEEAYRVTNAAAISYLRQRNVPSSIVDLMMQTSSADGYALTDEDKRRIGPMSVARLEYMTQVCGFPSPSQSWSMEPDEIPPQTVARWRDCGQQFYAEQRREFFGADTQQGAR